MSTVSVKFKVGGVLTNVTSAKLSDAAAAYGIKRNDTGAVVVADNISMDHDGDGLYSYTFTDPANDLVYTAAFEFVYSGATYRSTRVFSGPVTAATPAAAPASTGFLTRCISRVRMATGEPTVNAKYTDAKIIDENGKTRRDTTITI